MSDGGIDRYIEIAEEFIPLLTPGPEGDRGPDVPGPIVLTSTTNNFTITPGTTEILGYHTFAPGDISETDIIRAELWGSPSWSNLTSVGVYWNDTELFEFASTGDDRVSITVTLAQLVMGYIHYTVLDMDASSSSASLRTGGSWIANGGTISFRAGATVLASNSATVRIIGIGSLT
jgi:hypothetical protein